MVGFVFHPFPMVVFVFHAILMVFLFRAVLMVGFVFYVVLMDAIVFFPCYNGCCWTCYYNAIEYCDVIMDAIAFLRMIKKKN